jgi:hypothetical protein
MITAPETNRTFLGSINMMMMSSKVELTNKAVVDRQMEDRRTVESRRIKAIIVVLLVASTSLSLYLIKKRSERYQHLLVSPLYFIYIFNFVRSVIPIPKMANEKSREN